ncbi:hypothetical protein QL285_071027 [Trifolium repens]|nr:hypothetical protein QL285_071027 [Trifolium repens]
MKRRKKKLQYRGGWVRLLPHLILQMIKIEDGIASCYGCMNTHVHVDHATRTGQIKLCMQYAPVEKFPMIIFTLNQKTRGVDLNFFNFLIPTYSYHSSDMRYLSVSNFSSPLERLQEFKLPESAVHWRCAAMLSTDPMDNAHPFLVSVKRIRAEYESIHSRKLQVLDATKAQ